MNNCWCGETRANKTYSGVYKSALELVQYKLVECAQCNTVRTLEWKYNWKKEDENYIVANLEKSIRHQDSRFVVQNYLNGGSILDIGCAAGEFLKFINLEEIYNKQVGIDVKKYWSIDKEGSLELRNHSIENEMEVFDDLICIHCLEHIEDLYSFFQSLRKNIKSESRIYICVPNFGCVVNVLRDGCISDWGALSPQEHIWHFTVDTLHIMALNFLKDCRIVYTNTSRIWGPNQQIDLVLEVF